MSEKQINHKIHYLGRLCKRGHEYLNTGMSLRYKSSHRCVQCSKDCSKKPENILYQKEYNKKWYREHREKSQEYYRKNREKIQERYKENREERLSYTKKYYREHREESQKYSKKYYKKNRGRRQEQGKKWHRENREKNLLRSKRYGKEHREQIRLYGREYIKKACENLADTYIKQMLTGWHGVKRENITLEMIELKRELMTFNRLKKEVLDGINSRGNKRTEANGQAG